MEAFLSWLRQLEFDGVWQTAVLVCASLLCITFHETCHGLCAYWLGDNTAKRMGRLSLNPLKHVDLGGLLMMALFRFGWAKPVPIDMRNFKKPKAGMALTALAGPVSNVLLAFAAAILYLLCMGLYTRENHLAYYVIGLFFGYVEVLSAGLAVFNIFPIPPLDGSKVLFAILPNAAYYKLMRYEKYGMFVLMALLFLGVLDAPLTFLRGALMDVIERTAIRLIGYRFFF